jgi:hypothetical protein
MCRSGVLWDVADLWCAVDVYIAATHMCET